jgi:hypothetical protein
MILRFWFPAEKVPKWNFRNYLNLGRFWMSMMRWNSLKKWVKETIMHNYQVRPFTICSKNPNISSKHIFKSSKRLFSASPTGRI